MINLTLADLFAEARTLLEGKTVTKVYPAGTAANNFVKEPDPAYDALRNVVMEIITNQHTDSSLTVLRTDYWEQAPDKALEGALIGAVRTPDTRGEIHYSAAALSEVLLGILCEPDDTRIPAMQAFVDWLKREA